MATPPNSSRADAWSDVKQQVRAASDIVDVIGSYLNLRRQGRQFVALCPWHDDSRPSFQINPQRQSWRCWVCGIGGDVFNFVMRRESVEFREALELLAERSGIPLPTMGKPAAPGSPHDKQTQRSALAWAERLFHQTLLNDPAADAARRYLMDRRIDRDAVQRFHIGFSPNDWHWLCNQATSTPYSLAVLEAAGLIGKSQSGKHYDRFRGRVIFPIRDVQSRPIAFGGRILPEYADDKSAKYVNSPETKLFSKSENVFALDLARDAITHSGKVIVVEGYTDVIALQQAGIKNCVAVLGTALGPRHVQLLRRYADSVYLVLDGDEAGQKRTAEVLDLFLAQQVDLRIATLPENLDPCDFVQQHGPDAFNAQIENAVDAIEHKIRISTAGIDLTGDLHGANDALEDILNTLANVPHVATQTSSEVRLREHQFLGRIARKFQVAESELRVRISSLRKAKHTKNNPTESPTSPKVLRASDLENWDRMLLELLLAHPELVVWAVDEIGPDELGGEAARAVYQSIQEAASTLDEFDFVRFMSSITDESLRFLVIELDESASQKTSPSPEEEMKVIIQAYRKRHEDRFAGQQVAAMETKQLSETEELDVLNQIIQQQRNRQGISDPMEG